MRWSASVVAATLVIASVLTASNAWALALGRVSVQSMLGEPLRAEIDVPSITAAEAQSLQLGMAPPERFQLANMNFNPLLNEVRFELVQGQDGRFVIRLSSERAVTEPFLDMVVQAQWANGQLLRGYTILLDPPDLSTAPAPLLAVAPPPAPVMVEVRPAPTPAPAALPAAPDAVTTPAAPPVKVAPERVQVRRGDTASGIVLSHMPPDGASLDQMLIALLRANPNAFIGGNVNRLRADVTLELPSVNAASAIAAAQARQLVRAQSRDFNEYRRRLADMAQAQETPDATRRAEGAVQTEIADQQAAAQAQDRLTLAQAADAQRQAEQAEQTAQALQQQAAQQRSDELSRNLQELEQLREAAATATPQQAPAPSEPAPPPTEETPTPGLTAPLGAPAEPAPQEPAADPAPPAPAPQTESFIQTLSANPYALPAGAGVLALLALLGVLRWRQYRKQQGPLDEQQPDPMAKEPVRGRSVARDEEERNPLMGEAEIDLAADLEVDPVAEADVYLAYGRDKQAEDILLEALRLDSDNIPVRLKLLDIYAQRNDLQAFNATAQDIHALTDGQGPDWQYARETGLRVDPENQLYISGSTATAAATTSSDVALGFKPDQSRARSEDDELDELLRSEPKPRAATEERAAAPVTQSATDKDMGPIDLDIDIDIDLDLDTDTQSDATSTPESDTDASAGKAQSLAPTDDSSQLGAAATELPDDIKDLSLDLDESLDSKDPLVTKLSLAEEFRAIGDTEGARSLAQEVEAEASGVLKQRAQALLARLN